MWRKKNVFAICHAALLFILVRVNKSQNLYRLEFRSICPSSQCNEMPLLYKLVLNSRFQYITKCDYDLGDVEILHIAATFMQSFIKNLMARDFHVRCMMQHFKNTHISTDLYSMTHLFELHIKTRYYDDFSNDCFCLFVHYSNFFFICLICSVIVMNCLA